MEKYLIYFIALSFGLLFMLYSQYKSGQIQIESLGAAFICLYILTIQRINRSAVKPFSFSIITAAFFVMCAVMFKEPFLIIAVAAALIFINNVKDLLYKLILPLLYGGIMGSIIMILTGTLFPYLSIYLPQMIGDHISVYGNPYERGIHIGRLIRDIGEFSLEIKILVIILILFFVFSLYKETRSKPLSLILKFMKVPFLIYIVSFSVGLGGQYFAHHFVFAVPFYISLFIFMLEKIENSYTEKTPDTAAATYQLKAIANGFLTICLILTSAAFCVLPKFPVDQTVLDANSVMRQQAEYVDQLLEHYGINRYQYLGFNGYRFYGFTEHSPLGPVFIQDPVNFTENNTWFTKNMLSQMETADILIVEKIDMPVLNDKINEVIAEKFTKIPWDLSYDPELPADFPYIIYYRINAVELK